MRISNGGDEPLNQERCLGWMMRWRWWREICVEGKKLGRIDDEGKEWMDACARS
jgi:hypothetical protein